MSSIHADDPDCGDNEKDEQGEKGKAPCVGRLVDTVCIGYNIVFVVKLVIDGLCDRQGRWKTGCLVGGTHRKLMFIRIIRIIRRVFVQCRVERRDVECRGSEVMGRIEDAGIVENRGGTVLRDIGRNIPGECTGGRGVIPEFRGTIRIGGRHISDAVP